jgi:hypothetical protein
MDTTPYYEWNDTQEQTTMNPTEVTNFDPDVRCVRKYFNNKTQTYYIYKGYSGIPENLTFSLVIWLVGVRNNISLKT